METRVIQTSGRLEWVQHALLFVGEASWIYAWSVGLGNWLGGDGRAIVGPLVPAGLVLAAALVQRVTRPGGGTPFPGRVGLALLGFVVAAAVAYYELWVLLGGQWTDALDRLLTSTQSIRPIFAFGVALLAWWRGFAVGRGHPNLDDVEAGFRTGVAGLVVLLAGMMLLGQTSTLNAAALVLPTMGVISAGLIGMPLARIVDMSKGRRYRESSNLAPSGPWLATLLGVVGVLLLLTFLFANLLTFEHISALLAPLSGPLDTILYWVVYIVLLPFGLLVEGLIALLRLLMGSQQQQDQGQQQDQTGLSKIQEEVKKLQDNPTQGILSPEAILAIKVAIVVVIGIVVVLLLARAIRRIQDWGREQGVEEEHDFVWTWPGLASIWLGLRSLAGSRGTAGRQQPAALGASGLAESVRELYREFLALAASVGWPRRAEETPHEYEGRLGAEAPLAGKGEVREITASYVKVRYAPPWITVELPAVRAALARLRALWQDRPPP